MTVSKPGPNQAPLRWGILGAAEIARKNFKAIQLSGNCVVTGVASREPARCAEFIKVCHAETLGQPAPKAFASYEALLDSAEVDAVYIPLPTGRRKEWVLRAAAAGKHVVCEKPCAVTVADLEEMTGACRRHRVQFMDGVMFVHSERLRRMREALEDGVSVGPLRRVTSAFTFGAPPEFPATNIRAQSELEPHGCLGDLGWYNIRLSLWAMDWRLPLQVSGRLHAEMRGAGSPAPVPAEFSGEMLYEDGVSASFHCSFVSEIQQWALLSGRRGYLHTLDFVLPFAGRELAFDVVSSSYSIRGCDFSMAPGRRTIAVPEWSHGQPNAQESNLYRNFANQVQSGTLNDHWPEQALRTQQVMEACLASARADGKLVKVR